MDVNGILDPVEKAIQLLTMIQVPYWENEILKK